MDFELGGRLNLGLLCSVGSLCITVICWNTATVLYGLEFILGFGAKAAGSRSLVCLASNLGKS